MATDHEDWPVAPDPEQPEPGEYVIGYLRARTVERFSRLNIELDFEIIDSIKWAKKIVKMYFGIPMNGSPSIESKFYQAWCLANDGAPKRGDRMTPRIFSGYWHAELDRTKRTTTRNGGIRKLEDSEKGRIVVVRLIKRAAGSAPRATSRRGKALPPDELR